MFGQKLNIDDHNVTEQNRAEADTGFQVKQCSFARPQHPRWEC